MTPGPMDLGGPSGAPWASGGPTKGPVGFRRPSKEPMSFRGPIKMTLRNEYVEDRRPFFFCRSHQNPNKTCGIFPVCFGVHKTGDA